MVVIVAIFSALVSREALEESGDKNKNSRKLKSNECFC